MDMWLSDKGGQRLGGGVGGMGSGGSESDIIGLVACFGKEVLICCRCSFLGVLVSTICFGERKHSFFGFV